jgi:hypothetical protein
VSLAAAIDITAESHEGIPSRVRRLVRKVLRAAEEEAGYEAAEVLVNGTGQLILVVNIKDARHAEVTIGAPPPSSRRRRYRLDS